MNISDHKEEFEKIISHISEELKSIRTNRATPALVEQIPIDVYGSRTQLHQLASISVPEARQIVIEPWDKSIVKDIERSLVTAKTGLSIQNEGNLLRMKIPAMTEESRREIVKILHKKIESARIALRSVRDRVKDEIVKGERASSISEDDKYRLIEELDKTIREYTERIEEIGRQKEKEVMTV